MPIIPAVQEAEESQIEASLINLTIPCLQILKNSWGYSSVVKFPSTQKRKETHLLHVITLKNKNPSI